MDAYGFSIINPALKEDEVGPIHGINERIDLKSIDLTLKGYHNLREIFLFSGLYIIILQNEVVAILKRRHIHANILSKTG